MPFVPPDLGTPKSGGSPLPDEGAPAPAGGGGGFVPPSLTANGKPAPAASPKSSGFLGRLAQTVEHPTSILHGHGPAQQIAGFLNPANMAEGMLKLGDQGLQAAGIAPTQVLEHLKGIDPLYHSTNGRLSGSLAQAVTGAQQTVKDAQGHVIVAPGQRGLSVIKGETPAAYGAAAHIGNTVQGAAQLPLAAAQAAGQQSTAPLANSILGKRVHQEGVVGAGLSTLGDVLALTGAAGAALPSDLADAAELERLANTTKYTPENGYESAAQADQMAQEAAANGDATAAAEHANSAQNLDKAAALRQGVADSGRPTQFANQAQQGLQNFTHGIAGKVMSAPITLPLKAAGLAAENIPGVAEAANAVRESSLGQKVQNFAQARAEKLSIRDLAQQGRAETARLQVPVKEAFTQAAKVTPELDDQLAVQAIRRGVVTPLSAPHIDSMTDEQLQGLIDRTGLDATPAALRTAVDYTANPGAHPEITQAKALLDSVQAPADIRFANGRGASQVLDEPQLQERQAKVAGEASPGGIAQIQNRLARGPLAKIEAEAAEIRQRNLERQPGELTPAQQRQVAADQATVKSIRRFVEKEAARSARTSAAGEAATAGVEAAGDRRIGTIAGRARENMETQGQLREGLAGSTKPGTVAKNAAAAADAAEARAAGMNGEGMPAPKSMADLAQEARDARVAEIERQLDTAIPERDAAAAAYDAVRTREVPLEHQAYERPSEADDQGRLAAKDLQPGDKFWDYGDSQNQVPPKQYTVERVEKNGRTLHVYTEGSKTPFEFGPTKKIEDVTRRNGLFDTENEPSLRAFHQHLADLEEVGKPLTEKSRAVDALMQARRAEFAPGTSSRAENELANTPAPTPKLGDLTPKGRAESTAAAKRAAADEAQAAADQVKGLPKPKTATELQRTVNRQVQVANARTGGEAAATERLTGAESRRQATAESSARRALSNAEETAGARLERLTNQAAARAFRNDSQRLETLAERRDVIQHKIDTAGNRPEVQAPQVRTALRSAAEIRQQLLQAAQEAHANGDVAEGQRLAAIAGKAAPSAAELKAAGIEPTFVPERQVPEKPAAGGTGAGRPKVSGAKKLGSERMREGIAGPMDFESQQAGYEHDIAGQVRNEINRRLLTDVASPAASHVEDATLAGSDLVDELRAQKRVPVGLVRKNGVDTVDQIPDEQVTRNTPTMSEKAFNEYKKAFIPQKPGAGLQALNTVENAARLTKLLGPGFVLHKGITDALLDRIVGGVPLKDVVAQVPEALQRGREGTTAANIGVLPKPDMTDATAAQRAVNAVAEKGMVGFRTLDTTNRQALYQALREKGLSPMQAEERVKAAAGDIRGVNQQVGPLRHVITYPGWQVHLANVLADLVKNHPAGVLQTGALAQNANQASPDKTATTGGLDEALNPFSSMLGLGKGLPGKSLAQQAGSRLGSMIAPLPELGFGEASGANARTGKAVTEGGLPYGSAPGSLILGSPNNPGISGAQRVGNAAGFAGHVLLPELAQIQDALARAKGSGGQVPYRYDTGGVEQTKKGVQMQPGSTQLGAIARLLGLPVPQPVPPKKKR